MPKIPLYGSDGRVLGAYVYMLLCRDEGGPVYVKIGMTEHPDQRVHALRLGCPVTPHQFCTIRRSSRTIALKVERALHAALIRWRSSGEWYRVPIDEKTEFNVVLRDTLNANKQDSYSNLWERVPVQPLVKLAKRKKAMFMNKFHGNPAFRDFIGQSRRGLRSP